MSEIAYRDPKESKAQISAFARKVLRRIHALGGRSHTLEDVEQELWMAWVKACAGFKPEAGAAFSTYLFTGMRLHINRYIHNTFERFHGETIALSLDMTVDDAEGSTIAEAVPDQQDSAHTELERSDNFAFAMSKLSPRARQFLTFLKDQPSELLDEVKRLEIKSEYARSRGVACVVPQRLASSIVLDFMGCSRAERAKILAEVHEMGERLSA
jgi:RNA polymerase sigma factor (sigma-70 family)